VKTFTMPGTEIVAPNVLLGLMRIADKTDDEVRELVRTARDSGIDFIDHADIYGNERHGCERRFAEAMQLTSFERDEITIQTKTGIREGYFDFSYEHILESVEGSLKALRTDHIDILLLHRADALVEPEEVARAFDELEASGKVRAFGVSNHTPRQIDLLRKYLQQPIVANQVQLSITHSPIIAQGIAANMVAEPQSITLDGGGIVDYCRLHDITIQAWSPFQAGFFTGVFLDSPDHPELNAVIDRPSTTCRLWPSPRPGSPGTPPRCRWCSAPPRPTGSPRRRWAQRCRSPARNGTNCSAPPGTSSREPWPGSSARYRRISLVTSCRATVLSGSCRARA
jgi:predicted oxidoreductase